MQTLPFPLLPSKISTHKHTLNPVVYVEDQTQRGSPVVGIPASYLNIRTKVVQETKIRNIGHQNILKIIFVLYWKYKQKNKFLMLK